MTRHEFRKDARAQRKAIIFGAGLVIALWWLFLPSPFSFGGTAGRRAFRPAPAAPTPVVRVPVVQPPPAIDPFTKSVVGKWAGRETLPNRGQCVLGVDVRKGEKENFLVFTGLVCAALNPTGNQKDPLGFVETLRRGTNVTNASFSGTAQDGAIVLHAVENIGVSEVLQGCEITAMTLRPFSDNGLSVKWQEKQTLPVCQGGELVALRRPN